MSKLMAKDRLILKDVKPLENQTKGFITAEDGKHYTGVIYAVPSNCRGKFSEGEHIILRERTVVEKLTFDNESYWFVQNLDVLCSINKEK